jgi:hypothetical protein
MIWQCPYDHPYMYLSTDLEPYFDIYLLTGNQYYYNRYLGIRASSWTIRSRLEDQQPY